MKHSFIVEDLKTRLDKFLVSQLPTVSRSLIQKDIEAGAALVNGVVVLESKFVVRKDDVVEFKISTRQLAGKFQKEELKATNTPIKVLYNNHGLLIIDKPAGLTVHPGAGFKGETLASALLFHFEDIKLVGEEGRPGIVHRLDKDTSGVILVAKTQEMYKYLKDAFAERKVKKEYIALVHGRLEKQQGVIDTPIGRSKTDFRKYTSKNPVEAKESLTEYKVLEYLQPGSPPHEGELEGVVENVIDEGDVSKASRTSPSPFPDQVQDRLSKGGGQAQANIDNYTLILVKLHTGRTHQIRVHFASIGHPLMGDGLYGNKKTILFGLKRQFLHAKKIEVRLPDEAWIEAESDFPQDLKEVLETLNSKFVNQL